MRTTPGRGLRRAVVVVAGATVVLSACGGGGTEVDDGGETPSSVRLTLPGSPGIGDTLRISGVAVNRGGRSLPGVVPPVTVSVRGAAIRPLADGAVLAVDTGTVTVTGVTGAVRTEQTVRIGTPSTLALSFSGPDSVSVGDSVQGPTAEIRRDNVVRTDLSAIITSSDTTILRIVTAFGRQFFRPLAAGTVTLTASLGTVSVTRAIRVVPARVLSLAFQPTPTVADVGDTVSLTLAAFDVLGNFVDPQEATFSVASGPGRIANARSVVATGAGRVVVRVAVRDRVAFDTLEVMPPSQFTITLRPGVSSNGTEATIPPKLQRALTRAVKRWRQVIRDELPTASLTLPANTCRNPALNESVSGVLVHVGVPALGFGGILAQATACVLRPDGRTIQGFMEFNSDVLEQLGEDELFYTAAHELGHVLGIGTIWYRADGQPSVVLRVAGVTRYVGAQAVAQFDLLDNRATFTGLPIPLATDLGHWDPRILQFELMEPFSRATTRFSRVTVGAMADMGYGINPRSWDRYALPLPAFSRHPALRQFDLTGDVLPPFGVVQADGRVIPFR